MSMAMLRSAALPSGVSKGEGAAEVEMAGGEREKEGAGDEEVGDRRVAEEESTVTGGVKGVVMGARRARPFHACASRWAEVEDVDEVELDTEETEAPDRLLRAADCCGSGLALGVATDEADVAKEVADKAGAGNETGFEAAAAGAGCLNRCEDTSRGRNECLGMLLLSRSLSWRTHAPGTANEASELG